MKKYIFLIILELLSNNIIAQNEATTIVVITNPKTMLSDLLKDNSSFYERLTSYFSGSNHNILLTAGVNKVNLLQMKSLNDLNAFFDKGIQELNKASRITNSSVTVDDFNKVIEQFSQTDNLKIIFIGEKQNILKAIQKSTETQIPKSEQTNILNASNSIYEKYHPESSSLIIPVAIGIIMLTGGFWVTNLFMKNQRKKEIASKIQLKQEIESLNNLKSNFETKHVANDTHYTFNSIIFFLLIASTLFSYSKNFQEIKEKPIKIEVLDVSMSALRFNYYKDLIQQRIIQAQIEGNHLITYGDSIKHFNFSRMQKDIINPQAFLTFDSSTEIIAAIYKAKELADSLRKKRKAVIVDLIGDFDFDKDHVNQSLLLLKANLNKTNAVVVDTLSNSEIFASGIITQIPIQYRNSIFLIVFLLSIVFFILLIWLFIKTKKLKRNYVVLPKSLKIQNEFEKTNLIDLINPLSKIFSIGASFQNDIRISFENLSEIKIEIENEELKFSLINEIKGE